MIKVDARGEEIDAWPEVAGGEKDWGNANEGLVIRADACEAARQPALRSVAEEQHLRHGQFVRVGDGEQRRTAANRGEAARGAAVQL